MTYSLTVADFKQITQGMRDGIPGYKNPLCFAVGVRVRTGNGTLATVRYPVVNGPGESLGTAAILMYLLKIKPEGVTTVDITTDTIDEFLAYCKPFRDDGRVHPNIFLMEKIRRLTWDSDTACTATFIFDNIAPQGVEDSTLKLYALSHRFFKPNQLNVEKIFTKLPNVAWVGDTPMDADDIDRALMQAAVAGASFAPDRVDKFPLYAHRINGPKLGVRIGDSSKVRLGAYLGEGTTVMAGAGFVNFNAGTEGPSMVEGRVSSSAFIGAGSDVGGGASILGTLSGGNNVPISVGRNCLLEVNCALGIPIGDAVIIAQETGVMASSLVTVDVEGHPLFGQTVKAMELAGISGVTFRRNDKDGELEVVRIPRNIELEEKLRKSQPALNEQLHKNN
jgi:2,3,4,5-tetrahydropyridine-2,6-dicarboxylate N-succinyltransferase